MLCDQSNVEQGRWRGPTGYSSHTLQPSTRGCLAEGQNACSATRTVPGLSHFRPPAGYCACAAVHCQTALNTDSGALRRTSSGEETEWFQEEGVENPLRGLLMRGRNRTGAVSTAQHPLELRTLLHNQAECACSAAPRLPLSFLCACAAVIPSSRPTPNAPSLVVKAASFERAGKAVGAVGTNGYSLHGC